MDQSRVVPDGEFRKVRAFGQRVADALVAKRVAPEVITHRRTATPERRTRFMGRTVPATYVVEPRIEGWKVWGPQDLYNHVFKAIDYSKVPARTVHGSLGKRQFASFSLWLDTGGVLAYVESERTADNSIWPISNRYDYSNSTARMATDEDLAAADYNFRHSNTPMKSVHHEWREWERSTLWAKSPGMGVSSALRRLADANSVIPRRKRD